MTNTKMLAVMGSMTVVAMIAAGCGSKGASGDGASSGTVVIGAPVSLTGSLAREGQLTKEGYELCRDKVNDKGGIPVDGKKLELKIKYQDDKSQPDTAGRLVDQFNDDGVKLILSSYGSSNVAAQAPVAERNGQVLADSAGADDTIFNQGYEHVFGVLSPATEYASSMVKAIHDAAKPQPKSIAFLSADDGFSKTSAQGGAAQAKEFGYDVLPTETFPAHATDVSSALTKIKGKKPDVVIGTVHIEEGVAIIKQAKELGVRPMAFGETVAPPSPDFADSLGDAANGVLGSSQWSETAKGEDKYFGTAKDYSQAIDQKFGHVPDYHDAEASAACLSLVLSLEKAGSTDADEVRDAMAALDAESFFGRIKFNDKGKNVYKPMVVVQIQDGKAVTVWPEDAAEAKLVWPGTQS